MIKVNQNALIKQMLYQKKYIATNYVLVRPTEKVSRKSATSGKNESRALSDLIVVLSLQLFYKFFFINSVPDTLKEVNPP